MSAAPRLSSNILAKKRRFSYQHKNLSQSLTKGLSQNSGIGNDDQAFRELQQYADFQSVLSQRLCAEIDMDEPVYQSIDPQLLEKGHVAGPNLTPGHIHPALQTPISHHGLRSPVVIAAKTRNHEIEGWERAYAPSLMECGIDQNTFLHFIDTFNDTIQNLPPIRDAHVQKYQPLAKEEATKLVPFGDSEDILSPPPELGHRSKSILALANEQLFNPHGLFALVINPSSKRIEHEEVIETLPSSISHSAPLVLREGGNRPPTFKHIRPQKQIISRRRPSGNKTRIQPTSPLNAASPDRRSSRLNEAAIVDPNKTGQSEWLRQAKEGPGEEISNTIKPEETQFYNDGPYLMIINLANEKSITTTHNQRKDHDERQMEDLPSHMYGFGTPVKWPKYRRKQDFCIPIL